MAVQIYNHSGHILQRLGNSQLVTATASARAVIQLGKGCAMSWKRRADSVPLKVRFGIMPGTSALWLAL
jgi:hypothetical protein